MSSKLAENTNVKYWNQEKSIWVVGTIDKNVEDEWRFFPQTKPTEWFWIKQQDLKIVDPKENDSEKNSRPKIRKPKVSSPNKGRKKAEKGDPVKTPLKKVKEKETKKDSNQNKRGKRRYARGGKANGETFQDPSFYEERFQPQKVEINGDVTSLMTAYKLVRSPSSGPQRRYNNQKGRYRGRGGSYRNSYPPRQVLPPPWSFDQFPPAFFPAVGFDSSGQYLNAPLKRHEPAAIRTQLEWYFDDINLSQDRYMKSIMDERGYVPSNLIADFNRFRRCQITSDEILNAASSSPKLHTKDKKIRKKKSWWLFINNGAQPETAYSDGEEDQLLKLIDPHKKYTGAEFIDIFRPALDKSTVKVEETLD